MQSIQISLAIKEGTKCQCRVKRVMKSKLVPRIRCGGRSIGKVFNDGDLSEFVFQLH